MTIFRPDELVDITIRGARVDFHFDPAEGDTALTITIPGCEGQLDIPMVDDDCGPLPQVIVTRADIISAGTISVTPSPVMRAAVLAALADEDVDAAIAQATAATGDEYEFGSDYLTDPAARIKQIAAIHPEFVTLAVVAQRRWRDRDGSVWREGDNPRQMIFVSSSTPDDDLPAGRLTDRELLERHYGPLTEVVDQRPIRTEL